MFGEGRAIKEPERPQCLLHKSPRWALGHVLSTAGAPCLLATVIFALFCLTLGPASRTYFVHQGPQERYGFPLVIDEGGYVTIADNIALGNGYQMGWPDGYRTARRAPVFPLILAGLFRLFGPHGWLGLALNGVLLVATILFTGAAARLLLPLSIPVSVSAARWALVLVPSLYYFASMVQTEILSLFWAAAVIVLLLHILQSISQSNTKRLAVLMAALGMVSGLATLTRPELAIAAAMIGVFLLFVLPRHDAKPFLLTAFGLCFLFPLSVWIIHNFVWLGTFVPLTTTGGTTFYGAHNDMIWATNRGSWGDPPRLLSPDVWKQLNDLGEAARERELFRLGIIWLRSRDLGDIFVLAGYKLARLWVPYELFVHRFMSHITNILMSVLFLPFWILALTGLWSLLRRRAWIVAFILLIFPMASTISALLFYGSARFRVTSYPALAVLAAIGLHHAIFRLSSIRSAP